MRNVYRLVIASEYRSSTDLFPACIKSKASFIFSIGRSNVTNSSTIISLFMYFSTSLGTESLLL